MALEAEIEKEIQRVVGVEIEVNSDLGDVMTDRLESHENLSSAEKLVTGDVMRPVRSSIKLAPRNDSKAD